ncbi:hypothetical protein BcDW1_8039 [Botrytis cinerea BcDW1]|uniref:Uncharacterized protein n=1 Tax=Botryotinia fuckeliana (strain BcDW1) TaxID=1290391 RepID=M7UIK1_BOTF1|nr:hypothetical protein BcDW1_8039 [Botrytis cinerea BcDW1]
MSPVEVKVKITVKVKVEFEVEAILAICVASQLRTYERRSLVTGSCIVIGGTNKANLTSWVLSLPRLPLTPHTSSNSHAGQSYLVLELVNANANALQTYTSRILAFGIAIA